MSGRLPSSVTTSVSSMRTPPVPGRYTPGSTVTTVPDVEDSSRPRTHRWPLVDVEPHPVAGPVLEPVGPTTGPEQLAAGLVDGPGRHPGSHRRPPPLAGRRPPPRRPPPSRRWAVHPPRRCGSCPTGSRRRRPRSRPPPDRRRRMRRWPGRACGLAEFSPEATMVSNALSSAPRWRMAWSRAAAKPRLGQVALRSPTAGHGQQGEDVGQGLVGDGRGPLHAGHLGGILVHPQALDHPLGGHQLTGAEDAGPRPLARPGHVVGLQSHRPGAGRPGRPPPGVGPGRRRRRCRWRRPPRPRPAARRDWVRYRPSVVRRARRRSPGEARSTRRSRSANGCWPAWSPVAPSPPARRRRATKRARRRSSRPVTCSGGSESAVGGHRRAGAGVEEPGHRLDGQVGTPFLRTRRCIRRTPVR